MASVSRRLKIGLIAASLFILAVSGTAIYQIQSEQKSEASTTCGGVKISPQCDTQDTNPGECGFTAHYCKDWDADEYRNNKTGQLVAFVSQQNCERTYSVQCEDDLPTGCAYAPEICTGQLKLFNSSGSKTKANKDGYTKVRDCGPTKQIGDDRGAGLLHSSKTNVNKHCLDIECCNGSTLWTCDYQTGGCISGKKGAFKKQPDCQKICVKKSPTATATAIEDLIPDLPITIPSISPGTNGLTPQPSTSPGLPAT